MASVSTRAALVSAALVVSAVVLAAVLWFRLRHPFTMSIRPAGDGAAVRFAYRKTAQVSPEFPVDLPVRDTQMIILRDGGVTILGGTIEFADTTLLPGRFQIRIGETLFDVMERGIIVNGRDIEWQDDIAASNPQPK